MSERWLRRARPEDMDAIAALNDAAFKDKAEGDIVRALWKDGDSVLSLIAHDERRLIGHIEFYRLWLDGAPVAVGLGPMCAHPDVQKSGIGAQLIKFGLMALTGAGETICFVLGHKTYYPRFGFAPELAAQFASPFPRPEFMAKALSPDAPASGTLTFPKAFG
jgi:putative acetyltransferase